MSRNAPLVLLLGIALLCGGAVVWAASGSDLPPAPEPVARPAPDAPAAAPLAETASLPAERAREDATPNAELAAATDAAEERLEAPAAAPLEGPLVRVVHGDPPVPVPGAAVAYVEQEQAQALRRQRGLPPATDPELAEQHGDVRRADADGTLRLPPVQGTVLVAAVHEGEFAFAALRRRNREVTLRLVPDEPLRLLALGADDAPLANVPLAVHQGSDFGKANVVWRGATAADGTALVAHFQLRRNENKDAGDRFAVVVAAPTQSPAAAEFAGRPAPHEAVVVRVPHHGTVRTRVVDRTGTPLLTPATVVLRSVLPKDALKPVLPLAGDYGDARQRKELGAGALEFTPVGLGVPLQAVVRFDFERRGFRQDAVAGPRLPSEPAEVDLVLPADYSVLAGRVLGEDGRLLAGGRLAAALYANGVPVLQTTALACGDGRFDAVLRAQAIAGPTVLELRAAENDVLSPIGARVELAPVAAGSRVELGDVRLALLPALVTGTVTDDLGQPLAGARLRVQRAVRSGDDGEGWRDLPLLSADTAAEGTFTIAGVLPAGELRVLATANGHFHAEAQLRAAGEQLRLVAVRQGILAGRVLLPDWVPDGAASLHLTPVLRDRGIPVRATQLSRRRGGSFRVDLLRAGVYEVAVQLRNLPVPIAAFPNVSIAPGDNRDARLDPFDLRYAIHRYRLRALGPDGRPFAADAPVLVKTVRDDGSRADAGFRFHGGRCEIVAATYPLEVVVFGRGLPPQKLTLVPGDHDVWLQPQQPAVLHLPGLRALVGPERSVRVSLILTTDTGYPQSLQGVDQRSGEQFAFNRWDLGKSNGAWLGGGDTVEVPLALPGRYEVVLRIGADGRQNGPQGSVPAGTIDVVLGGPPHTVAFDGARIRAAIGQLDAALQQQRLQQQQQQRERGNRR